MFRLIFIWWTACRFRLDILLYDVKPSWWLRLVFLPALLFTKGSKNKEDNKGENLRYFFETLGPVAIKFGQLLSTRPDLIPKSIALELNKLQDHVAPIDTKHCIKAIETSLGRSVNDIFNSFENDPIGSASLAQVHKATLITNADKTNANNEVTVAVKVLRPNIEKQINRDIRFLRWVARWAAKMIPEARRLKPEQVVEGYAMVITQECDFRLEAANTQTMQDNFIGNPIHYSPSVYWDYTRRDVLVTEYIDAIPVSDVVAMQQQGINIATLAENGVRIFFKQVFEHNFFHADMHPGNIFVNKQYLDNPQYISIDCAIVGSLSDLELFQIGSLWLAVFERNYSLVAEIMIASGWVRRSTPVAQLRSVIHALYEPIHNKPISEVAFSYLLLDLFDQTRTFGLSLKPSQVLLQKTLINIEGLGKQLYPELDMFSIAKPFLRNWLKQRMKPETILKKWAFHGPMLMQQLHQLPALLVALQEADEQF